MTGREQAYAYHAAPPSDCPRDDWKRAVIHRPHELYEIVKELTAEMRRAGYPRKHQFAVELALWEAVINAVKHGHQGDPAKRVRVGYQVRADRVLMEVEDQGAGFDPRRVPDPRDPENLDKPCGRGLLLMRSYTTWLRFNARGNRVTLCRARSG